MKVLDKRLIHRQICEEPGVYQILLEVTDDDLDMLERLATVQCVEDGEIDAVHTDWLKKAWRRFWELWRDYPALTPGEARIEGRIEHIQPDAH